jgi:hypothetical protein
MSEIIVLKQSAVPGKIPSTKDLQFGEPAVNTFSGQLFLKRTDRVTEELVTFSSNFATSTKLEKVANTVYVSLDISQRQAKEIAITANTQIAFTNSAPASECASITLFINNSGDNAISWLNDIIWENGRAPMIAANAWTIIEIISYDGGKKTFGVVKGTNLKEA